MTKKTKQLKREQSAFLLAEEAIELVLRTGPTGFAIYLIGTLPFVAAMIAYWATMVSSAFAHQYASAGALGLALMFIWMKTLQARYAAHLLAQLQDSAPTPWRMAGFFQTFCRQGIIHASVVIIYPICFITVLPMCFVAAWYQNVTVMDGQAEGTRALVRDAAAQARLWPKQIHLFLWLSSPLMIVAGAAIYLGTFPVLDGLVVPELGEAVLYSLGYIYGGLLLFAILPLSPFPAFVMLNIATGLLFSVEIFHILTGADTLYSRNPTAILSNTTLIAVACGLTYVCLDPMLKAGFAIRCHQGMALRSGADLHVALSRISQKSARATAAVLLAALAAGLWHQSSVHAQGDTGDRIVKLDQALDHELAERKYTWRMPREQNPDIEMPWLLQAISDLGQSIRDGITAAFRFIGDLWERFTDWLRGDSNRSGGNLETNAFNPSWRHLIVLLSIGLLVAIAILLWRYYRNMPSEPVPVLEAPATAVPDIGDESTTAAELPEDEWFRLARELADKGDYRLAARALFFSGLATLAQREVIRIARFKSNLDYHNEILRRAASLGDAPAAFSDSALIYESVWYGEHEASLATLNSMHACQEKLRHACQ